MQWYLVHSKPKQEKIALENLERQGYTCYLPMLAVEKLRRGAVTVAEEPLFPRYLFIRLGRDGDAKSWSPIRSTRGVSRLVMFGVQPARVDAMFVDLLRTREAAQVDKVHALFPAGARVQIMAGAFVGIEGVFEIMDGERRAMVLIEFLSKPVRVPVMPAALRAM